MIGMNLLNLISVFCALSASVCADNLAEFLSSIPPDDGVRIEVPDTVEFTEVGPRAFSNFPFLKYLTLEYNGIEDFHQNAFQGTQLISLEIIGSTYQSAPNLSDIKETLTSLEMSDNKQLEEIEDGYFRGLKLTHLAIGNNSLESVPNLADIGNTLQRLSLKNNRITSVTEEKFEGMHALTHLDLTKNRIEHIAPRTFMDLTALIRLDLSHNNVLNNFTKESFRGLQALTWLGLGFNGIQRIAPDTFEYLADTIDELQLQGNSLSAISDNTFQGLVVLEELNLRNNGINTVTSKAFQPISKNVYYIDLGYNQLTHLPPSLFTELTSLQGLILSGNILHHLPQSLFGLTTLKNLGLSSMGLQHLPDLAPLNQTTFLDLDKNNFTSVSSQEILSLIRSLPDLQFLRIRDCGLQSFPDIRSLDNWWMELAFNNNPLECSCELLWLADSSFIEERMDPVTRVKDLRHVYCTFPNTSPSKRLNSANYTADSLRCNENERLQTTSLRPPTPSTTTPLFSQDVGDDDTNLLNGHNNSIDTAVFSIILAVSIGVVVLYILSAVTITAVVRMKRAVQQAAPKGSTPLPRM